MSSSDANQQTPAEAIVSDSDKEQSKPPVEVDCLDIIRPSLFHTRDVSGLLIPVTQMSSKSKSGLEASWQLYFQRSKDGKRECRKLKADQPLGIDNSALWFQSISENPTIGTRTGWSSEARKRWLDGYTPDLKSLYEKLYGCFDYFLEFPPQEKEGRLVVLSLWTMLTYAYPAWSSFPYLSLGGALGSGKSTVCDVIERIAFKPTKSSSMTTSCLFRIIDADGGTLILDESESLKDKTPEAAEKRSILNGGYQKTGRVHRSEPSGDSFMPKPYFAYSPKVIAGISSLPTTIASRSIRIMMFKAGKDSEKPRHRLDSKKELFENISDDLHAFALSYGHRFLDMAGDMSLCDGMYGRDIEKWQPLLVLAKVLQDDEGVPELVSTLRHSMDIAIAGNDAEVNYAEGLVLSVFVDSMITYTKDNKGGVVPSRGGQPKAFTAGEVLAEAKKKDGRTFSSYSPKGIGTILGRYGIKNSKTCGKLLFKTTAEHLRKIQDSYGFELGF